MTCRDAGAAAPSISAPAHGVQVAGASNVGLEQIRTSSPDVIVLDLDLSEQSGLEFLQQVVASTSASGHRCHQIQGRDEAIEAMKQGAYDCLFQPSTYRDPARRWRGAGCGSAPAATSPLPSLAGDGEGGVTGTDPDVEGAIIGACRPWARSTKPSARRCPRRPRADHRRERYRQGTGGTRIYSTAPSPGALLALNCAAIPKICWRASCSAMRRALSPAPTATHRQV